MHETSPFAVRAAKIARAVLAREFACHFSKMKSNQKSLSAADSHEDRKELRGAAHAQPRLLRSVAFACKKRATVRMLRAQTYAADGTGLIPVQTSLFALNYTLPRNLSAKCHAQPTKNYARSVTEISRMLCVNFELASLILRKTFCFFLVTKRKDKTNREQPCVCFALKHMQLTQQV